jgi:hypothetical protein
MNCFFDTENHIYRVDERLVPSVTQILGAVGILPDFSRIDRAVLERKRKIGVALHACLHFLQEGDLDLSTVDDEVRPRLEAYELFVSDTGFKPLDCELRMWPTVNGMRYGGCADVIGELRNEPALVDFKTTSGTPSAAWGCQTAAYSHGLKAPLRPPFHYRRFSLQLFETGRYSLHEWSDKGDFQTFTLALALCYWKINKGEFPWQ